MLVGWFIGLCEGDLGLVVALCEGDLGLVVKVIWVLVGCSFL